MKQIYTHYYNETGQILMVVPHNGNNIHVSSYNSFDSDTVVNSLTHRYNTETGQVEPKE